MNPSRVAVESHGRSTPRDPGGSFVIRRRVKLKQLWEAEEALARPSKAKHDSTGNTGEMLSDLLKVFVACTHREREKKKHYLEQQEIWGKGQKSMSQTARRRSKCTGN